MSVVLLRPYGPSASLYRRAARALVHGDRVTAARLVREADRALRWELETSATRAACDAILRKATGNGR